MEATKNNELVPYLEKYSIASIDQLLRMIRWYR